MKSGARSAEELLLSTHMKLSKIAVRLGYTESAAFHTAFRRWHGESPSAFRRRRHPAARTP
ncbi:helix-turn-helix domain-containing protein [Sinimarinibacterium thermocellulolyticum]|uniref:Helix-turn-helix domain-containing protein n=1 Tax=Sinimarinibacterium thermocellulolyticum TaxID=3170016 RepID=A0ABV2AEY4_9GAMM